VKINYKNILKNKDLSLTSVRVAVLDVLKKLPHSDASTIYKQVQKKIATASKQAIYNNLHTLLEHGIVREIKPKGLPSLYETRIDDNHHHLICRHCQQIIDVDCQDFAPCLSPIDRHGFVIDEAEITFWGSCPACLNSTTNTGEAR
jgi:Fur family ferric uptake transcriptional regulator